MIPLGILSKGISFKNIALASEGTTVVPVTGLYTGSLNSILLGNRFVFATETAKYVNFYNVDANHIEFTIDFGQVRNVKEIFTSWGSNAGGTIVGGSTPNLTPVEYYGPVSVQTYVSTDGMSFSNEFVYWGYTLNRMVFTNALLIRYVRLVISECYNDQLYMSGFEAWGDN